MVIETIQPNLGCVLCIRIKTRFAIAAFERTPHLSTRSAMFRPDAAEAERLHAPPPPPPAHQLSSSSSSSHYYNYYDYYYGDTAPVVAGRIASGAGYSAGYAYDAETDSSSSYSPFSPSTNTDVSMETAYQDYNSYDPCLYDVDGEYIGGCDGGGHALPVDPWHVAVWTFSGVGIMLNLVTIVVFLQQGRVTGQLDVVENGRYIYRSIHL